MASDTCSHLTATIEASRRLLAILRDEIDAPEVQEMDQLLLRLLAMLNSIRSASSQPAAAALRALLSLNAEDENEMVIGALFHDAEEALAAFAEP